MRKHPQTLLPYQVYLHRIGDDIGNDRLVYEEQDDTYYVGLGETTSEDYIVIGESALKTLVAPHASRVLESFELFREDRKSVV